jgi:hypothetical protein
MSLGRLEDYSSSDSASGLRAIDKRLLKIIERREQKTEQKLFRVAGEV